MEFEGKVAVITGAASGIGRSVALALAKLGTDIIIADIDDTRMAEVYQEIKSIGRRALAVHCDVSQDASVANLAAQTLSTLGRVDILMNNAGVGLLRLMENLSMSDWEWILGINLLGVIRGVRAFLPHMLKRNSGYIINTSSIAGLMPDCGPLSLGVLNLPYITSKFGLVGFSEGLYAYLKPKGIMVSVLCPGGVATNWEASTHRASIKSGEENQLNLPDADEMGDLGEIMEPDAVAQIVIKAMNEKRFLILTHPVFQTRFRERGLDIQQLEKHIQDVYKA